MTEQAVQKLRIVDGPIDTAVGEQAVGLVSFVDEAGNPVDIGGGGGAQFVSVSEETGVSWPSGGNAEVVASGFSGQGPLSGSVTVTASPNFTASSNFGLMLATAVFGPAFDVSGESSPVVVSRPATVVAYSAGDVMGRFFGIVQISFGAGGNEEITFNGDGESQGGLDTLEIIF